MASDVANGTHCHHFSHDLLDQIIFKAALCLYAPFYSLVAEVLIAGKIL